MKSFLKNKKNVEKVINSENDLEKYAHIYDSCENDICNIYVNIYEGYKKGMGANKEDVFECPRRMEAKIQSIIEKKNVNDVSNDKSIKKSIDVLIYPCIYEINKNKNYLTRSCCSGRVIIFEEVNEKKCRKSWLNKKFDIENVSNDEIKKRIEKDDFISYLKKIYDEESENYKSGKGKYSNYEHVHNLDDEKNREDIELVRKRKGEKIHRKKVHIFYTNHMHQNLEHDTNFVKNILTKEVLSKKEVKTACMDGENGDTNKIINNSENRKSNRVKKVEFRSSEEDIEHWMKYNDDLTQSTREEIKQEHMRRIYIKFEPFIIHVKCVDFISALKLLKVAQIAGLKQSGILNFNKYSVTVAIRGSMRLEHLMTKGFTFEREEIKKLLRICNEKMSLNLKQLVTFYHCYSEYMKSSSNWENIDQHLVSKKMVECYQPSDEQKGEKYELNRMEKRNLTFSGRNEEKKPPPGLSSLEVINNFESRERYWKNNKIEVKKRQKREIDLNTYNVELSVEGYVINKFPKMEGKQLLKWKLLTTKEDLENFFVWGHDMFMHKSKIYIFGGFAKGVRNSNLKIYDVDKKELRTYETELPALSYHSFFQLDDNYACIFGGRKNPRNCTNDVWLYDIRRNVWTLANWSGKGVPCRMCSNCINHMSEGMTSGMQQGKDSNLEDGLCTEFLRENCTSKAQMCTCNGDSVPNGRYRHACVFVRRYKKKQKDVYEFYMYGGVKENNEILNDIWKGKLTVRDEVFVDKRGRKVFIEWQRKHTLHEKTKQKQQLYVKNHTMVYNKKRKLIYIIGGCYNYSGEGREREVDAITIDYMKTEGDMNLLHLNRLYTYDVKKDIFFFMTCTSSCGDNDEVAYPLNRFSHATCLINYNNFVLMGGLNMDRTLNDIWIFRMKEKKWYHVGFFPFQSMYVRGKVASQNGCLYVIGGGCTVFTFGSFFDLPVYADCRAVLLALTQEGQEVEVVEDVEVEVVEDVEVEVVEDVEVEVVEDVEVEVVEDVEVEVVEEVEGVEDVEVEEMEDVEKVSGLACVDPLKGHGVPSKENKLCNSYSHAKWKRVTHERNETGSIKEQDISCRREMCPLGKRVSNELYLIVKERTCVKDVKTFLESIKIYDKNRKIEIFKEELLNGNIVDAFLIPILKKIESLKKFEQIRQNISLCKVHLTEEGQIYYARQSGEKKENEQKKTRKRKKQSKKRSLKECFTGLLTKFVNKKIKNYVSASERKQILRASTKYEIVGNILIFHYMHLEPIVRLYRTFRRRNREENKTQEHYSKNNVKGKKFSTLNYTNMKILMRKCKERQFLEEVDKFWIDVKNTFNRFRGKPAKMHKQDQYPSSEKHHERQGKTRGWRENNDTVCKFANLVKRLTALGRRKLQWEKKSSHEEGGKKKRTRIKLADRNSRKIGRRRVKIDQLAKMKKWSKELYVINEERKNKKRGAKIKSIAIYEKIQGAKRKNKIHLVYGKNVKTIHRENNVMYKLNLKKCMFCLGNGTEKERMKNLYKDESNMVVSKENVVDLFCGAGYFTLPLLKFVGNEKINEYYACDINEDSLKLLRESIRLNKIKKNNLHILRMNSFLKTKNVKLVKKCHRILLGLLPHSKDAWQNAFHMIDDKVGGVLHIHGTGENTFLDQFFTRFRTYDYVKKPKVVNIVAVKHFPFAQLAHKGEAGVDEAGEEGEADEVTRSRVTTYGDLLSPPSHSGTIGGYHTNCKNGITGKLRNKSKDFSSYTGNNIPVNLYFAQFVLYEIFKLALNDYFVHKTNWNISILHVERVKSYAPHIYHYVVDVRCTPEFV
ncbi:hypothetical protein, conserved [Plasmodium gonderi]|uniref:tRNA(Phe) 7-[(3-amino-3-carboxypropyl)-4-demethylwyosine(37)-N(4)]-methyltransferase n=1 Tax=Plasmodium gonderi TaxID=77519 RepID=A0A1Y1JDZ1_PLAGO|nr:hypothetical protein, conserved [Plasmodium gonderi]GAW79888.1 hypothetical protein, conserved [Plasmodium gonderi]